MNKKKGAQKVAAKQQRRKINSQKANQLALKAKQKYLMNRQLRNRSGGVAKQQQQQQQNAAGIVNRKIGGKERRKTVL